MHNIFEVFYCVHEILPKKIHPLIYRFLILLLNLLYMWRATFELDYERSCLIIVIGFISLTRNKVTTIFSKQTFRPNFSTRRGKIPLLPHALPSFSPSSKRHDAATGDVVVVGGGGVEGKSAAGEIIRSKIYPPNHPGDARGDEITGSRYRGKFRVNDSVIVFQEFPVWTSGLDGGEGEGGPSTGILGTRGGGKEEPFCTFVEVTSRAEVTLRHLCRGETSLLPCRAFRSEGIEARRRQMARGAMRRYLITAVMGRGFVANTFACWIESKIDASQCVVYARFDHTTRRERQMKLETKLCWYR